ncbi:hypothetical protein F511_33814 [Dorcoceras hygrometricum]|uniref:Uncharacterized protein n=1 Tax=Dorcoceras hygrometricum TaxID=472368 RepID=A0A2Z7CIV9_9LAMI|nr:hypothetical protein F511_33814 [Dorcoceras hygrometricum]
MSPRRRGRATRQMNLLDLPWEREMDSSLEMVPETVPTSKVPLLLCSCWIEALVSADLCSMRGLGVEVRCISLDGIFGRGS